MGNTEGTKRGVQMGKQVKGICVHGDVCKGALVLVAHMISRH